MRTSDKESQRCGSKRDNAKQGKRRGTMAKQWHTTTHPTLLPLPSPLHPLRLSNLTLLGLVLTLGLTGAGAGDVPGDIDSMPGWLGASYVAPVKKAKVLFTWNPAGSFSRYCTASHRSQISKVTGLIGRSNTPRRCGCELSAGLRRMGFCLLMCPHRNPLLSLPSSLFLSLPWPPREGTGPCQGR